MGWFVFQQERERGRYVFRALGAEKVGINLEKVSALKLLQTAPMRDFPGSPVGRTPCFYCRGHGFNPWGN